MTYEKIVISENFKCSHNSSTNAGTLIFNKSITKMLLVRGRISQKWGPPKGHVEKGESLVDTAVRETYEETGIKINSKNSIKFKDLNKHYQIILAKITFFIFILNEETTYEPLDSKEICSVEWFDIEELKKINSENSFKNYNSPLRCLLNNYNDKFDKLCNNLKNLNEQNLHLCFV